MHLISVEDCRKLAQRKLPRSMFDLVDGGAEDEFSMRKNRTAFNRFSLQPRILKDVSERDQSVTVLGQKLSMPVILAPTGVGQACWPHGDILAAKAAGAMGTIFSASTYTQPSLEDIAQGGSGHKWFQLYIWRDKELVKSLIERARVAGYSGIILTVDVPVFGSRERDIRNSTTMPPRITFGNALESLRHPGWLYRWLLSPAHSMGNLKNGPNGTQYDMKSLAELIRKNTDPSVTWKDLDWIRSIWQGPIILKGLTSAEDAKIAVSEGVDAIVVSNHGGRQLDRCSATIDVLADIVDAVDGKSTVIFDGGIMRGTEALIALALGAKAVMIGKAYLYGLSIGGEKGVQTVLNIFKSEIDRAMGLLGVCSLSELNRTHIRID